MCAEKTWVDSVMNSNWVDAEVREGETCDQESAAWSGLGSNFSMQSMRVLICLRLLNHPQELLLAPKRARVRTPPAAVVDSLSL